VVARWVLHTHSAVRHILPAAGLAHNLPEVVVVLRSFQDHSAGHIHYLVDVQIGGQEVEN
jgi:hypothetical protein